MSHIFVVRSKEGRLFAAYDKETVANKMSKVIANTFEVETEVIKMRINPDIKRVELELLT